MYISPDHELALDCLDDVQEEFDILPYIFVSPVAESHNGEMQYFETKFMLPDEYEVYLKRGGKDTYVSARGWLSHYHSVWG